MKTENKKRMDIMLDIETLGTKTGATIIQIAAMGFDAYTGKTYEEANFNESIDMLRLLSREPQLINADRETLKFWLLKDENADVLRDIIKNGVSNNYSEADLLNQFLFWLMTMANDHELYVWGNGILFDNKRISDKLESIGQSYPIHFRNDRDLRTLVELAVVKSGISEKDIKATCTDPNERKHDAFDDVKFQIRLVHKCNKLLEIID